MVWVICAFDQDQAYVCQRPNEQDLNCLMSLVVGSTRAGPPSTYVRPHTGIIILRSLLLFRKIPPRPLFHWLPGLQVDDRILVHLVCVRQHLDVDLRMAVLDDGAKINFDRVVLFGSPRDLLK